jgi:non-specific protein-tyrosine kinase
MRFRRGPSARVSHGLVSFAGEHTPEAEAYRLLRTNLDFTRVESPWKTLLVASAGPGEGKSTTVANLALALAQTGRKVVAVDADLRKPALHRIFQLDNQRGLTNLLLGWGEADTSLEHHLAPGPGENLLVLTSGPLPPNPAELLQGQQFARVLEALRRSADLIVLDSPPTLAVADALLLAQRTDATLLVVDTGRTRADSVRQAVVALRQSGTRLLGAVLNKQARRAAYGSSYYYYYSSERDENGRNGAKSKLRERQLS